MLLRTLILLLCCALLLFASENSHVLAETLPDSSSPSISADGRFIAFESGRADLVSGDTNGFIDIFVRDMQAGEVTRVSLATDGTQANDSSTNPVISGNGRYVAFASNADNLAPGNTDFNIHIYVHDRQTATTTRASVSSGGTQANGSSLPPSLSYDGQFVIFGSDATNLVSGDSNNRTDLFMYNTQTGETTRVSVTSTGEQLNSNSKYGSLSADNRYLAFDSTATNLVTPDNNSASDVFVKDLQTGDVTRVSVSSTGVPGNTSSAFPKISANGRYVVFYGFASNLVTGDTNGTGDTFVHDRQTGETTRVSISSTGAQGVGFLGSNNASISADGRFVTFHADFTNLVPNDTNDEIDVFLHDRQTGETTRISVSASGVQGNSSSFYPSMSEDARWIAFTSNATNLVSGDDIRTDIFLLDRLTGELTKESQPPVPVPTLTSPADGAALDNDRPTFRWNALSGIGRYEIRIDTINPPVRQFDAGKATQFTPTTPLLALPYFWQVRAVGTGGRISGWSAPRSLTITAPFSAAPIRHFFNTPAVTLTWNRIDDAATYQVQVDDTSTFSGTLAFEQSVSAPALTATTTPLTNGSYYWRVRACNGVCGAWSTPILFAVID